MEKPIVINALKTEGCCVPKGWGDEIIIENNEMYCGKLLRFKQGAKFSMHYHMIKDETWYVDKGWQSALRTVRVSISLTRMART